MSMRSALGHARGLGSAKEGMHHWWVQKVTAVALVPLFLWFAVFAVALTGADHATVVAAIGYPVNAVLLIVLIVVMFYHGYLGMQVVYEDYAQPEAWKLTLLLVTQFAFVLLALGGVFAILKIALGS